MAQLPIPYGAAANDHTGIAWRTAFQRTHDNFTDLYSLRSRTISVGDVRFNGAATSGARVQLAVAQAIVELAKIVFVGQEYLPYDITEVTSLAAFHASGGRLVREGGNFSTYDVLAYGASSDGVTPATKSFIAALAGAAPYSGTVFVPDATVGYLWTELVTMPVSVSMEGGSKTGTRLIHGYNGEMMQLALGDRLENLWFDGNGANFTGVGIKMFAGGGKQTVRSCRIVDFNDYCIDFSDEFAGSQSYWEDIETYQLVGTSAGQEAVIVRGSFTALAQPRTFVGIRTLGKAFIDLGTASNLFIVGSRIEGVTWSDNCRSVSIVGCRIGSTIPTMEIKGADHAISGTHIGPAITLGAGLSNTSMSGNSYDTPEIIDNSANATNMIDMRPVSYTPTLTAAGTAPVLGNGTLTGTYHRAGSAIFYRIELTLGSTTTLGTSELRFGLPIARVSGGTIEVGGVIGDDSGTRYTAIAQIPGAVGYLRMMRDTSGLFTATSPVTWATGDTIRVSGQYYL